MASAGPTRLVARRGGDGARGNCGTAGSAAGTPFPVPSNDGGPEGGRDGRTRARGRYRLGRATHAGRCVRGWLGLAGRSCATVGSGRRARDFGTAHDGGSPGAKAGDRRPASAGSCGDCRLRRPAFGHFRRRSARGRYASHRWVVSDGCGCGSRRACRLRAAMDPAAPCPRSTWPVAAGESRWHHLWPHYRPGHPAWGPRPVALFGRAPGALG